ncbi:UNVERIFIED_CONTAM: hypothetical protein NCL1_50803 [Trichonephila clavipes]
MTNAREDRYIIRLVLQNRRALSRNISLAMGMFAARPVSARMVRRRLQHVQYPLAWCYDVCSSVYCPQGDHYCTFPRQCRIATEGDSGAQND